MSFLGLYLQPSLVASILGSHKPLNFLQIFVERGSSDWDWEWLSSMGVGMNIQKGVCCSVNSGQHQFKVLHQILDTAIPVITSQL